MIAVQRLRTALSAADEGGLVSLDVFGDALYKMKDLVEQRLIPELLHIRSPEDANTVDIQFLNHDKKGTWYRIDNG